MKDSRPDGRKVDKSIDYNWNIPNKRGWSFKEQKESRDERSQIRFRGKPQHKK